MMEIKPLRRPLNTVVRVPGSKSITNRALPIAALAEGTSRLSNVLFSDDSRFFMDCLKRLGFVLNIDEKAEVVEVIGTGGKLPVSDASLYVGNSGTTARFITSFVTLGNGTYTIDGNERMRKRPIRDLLEALERLGADVADEEGTGCPPIVVRANGLRGGRTSVIGKNSSQYLSGMLMAAPYAKSDVDIHIDGELASQPYIHITTRMMKQFGVECTQQEGAFHVRCGQRYRAREYSIEPDASNASYFLAAAAVCGGRVRVANLTKDSLQGDAQFARILEQMGCGLVWGSDYIEVTGPVDGVLRGIDVDMNDIPDTAQTLAAIAPFAREAVTVRNVANLRIKETDRISAVVSELRKLGVNVEEYDDGFRVEPCLQMRGGVIQTYDDHRMAMAFSLIGLNTPGIIIEDPDCVQKSFPGYFEVLHAACETNT